ncbi:MAG: hypothetical protein Ta2E_02200 [Mycoplasmoidaceae bacterium]|nr:MAG: hypothetical protein Ta2E_02200 [Mycoplasmoidaceae bacterium]
MKSVFYKIFTPVILTLICSAPILIFTQSCSKTTNRFIRVNPEDNFFTLDYTDDYKFNEVFNYKVSAQPNVPSGEKTVGIVSDEVLRRFLSEKFYNNKMTPFPEWSPTGGCDSFNSFNPETNSWNFSRNFDYWYNLNELDPDYKDVMWDSPTEEFTLNQDFDWHDRPASALVHTNPKKSLTIDNKQGTVIPKHLPVESVSTVYLPFFYGDYSDPNKDPNNWWKMAPYWAFDGMNKNGVSISINVSGNCQLTRQFSYENYDNFNYDKINLNSFTFVRLILDYAKDVDDALFLMNNFYLNDMQFEENEPIHYQISDKTGDSAIVEYVEGFGCPSVVVRGEDVANGGERHIQYFEHTIWDSETDYVEGDVIQLSDTDYTYFECIADVDASGGPMPSPSGDSTHWLDVTWTPDYVDYVVNIPADTATNYEIAGKGKYFLINENFNLYNITGAFDELPFDTWVEVDQYCLDEQQEYKINLSEVFGRYYEVKKLLEACGGLTANPMSILEATRMYYWNSWSVVYDLNNFTTELVYMQQYESLTNKTPYVFDANYFN